MGWWLKNHQHLNRSWVAVDFFASSKAACEKTAQLCGGFFVPLKLSHD